MKKNILINEISRALAENSCAEYYYGPIFHSDVQYKFFEKRFTEVKKVLPSIKWLASNNEIAMDSETQVYAWQAFEEQNRYKQNLVLNAQNRLFDEIDFTVADSFTNFRKKVEPILPEVYKEAIAPYDEEVKSRVDYYFYASRLPSTYFETRNGMLGPDDSSRFSPYLSSGCLDVRYLYNEIKAYESRHGANKSTYWLVFELLWREFFYWHYQKSKSQYFSHNGIQGSLDFSDFPKYTFADLRKKSDSPFWQAALNELESTGFQTNRTRQLFASYWLNELELNWRSGAYLFETNLIDYDVFSNWGNWMYLAGVGVDARGPRWFNIESQLERYNPDNSYIQKWT